MLSFRFLRNGHGPIVATDETETWSMVCRDDAVEFFRVYGSVGEDALEQMRAGLPASGILPSACARAISLGQHPDLVEAARKLIVGDEE